MRSICTFVIVVGVLPLSAQAVLVTDSSLVPATAPAIDFSQFYSVGRIVLYAGDPAIEIDTLPSETVLLRPVLGTSAAAIVLGQHTPPAHPDNNFYLGVNGYWGPSRLGFLGIGGGDGSLVTARIEFSNGPVSLVGGLFNYSPAFPPII